MKIIEHGSKEYKAMIQLRINVLLNPIGVPASFINQPREKDDFLIGAFEGDEMIGCCVLSKRETDLLQLRQMAVQQASQGKGLGRLIIDFAENVAKENGFKKMVLHARDVVIPFYLKNGYTISGDGFTEVGVPHHVMIKELQGQ